MKTLRVIWHWQTMGPYHFARMRALASVPGIELTVVESTSVDDHGWKRSASDASLHIVTLASEPWSPQLLMRTQDAFESILKERQPDLVVAAGYARAANLNPIIRYKQSNAGALSLLWSESTVSDHKRRWLKEAMKRLIIPVFDGAITAGHSHASYLVQLGMSSADIQVVGNCVDNDFFSRKAAETRRHSGSDMPSNNFLFVGRMIAEKNLSTLIDAYGAYRRRVGSGAWSLVLVGSGPEESSLKAQVAGSAIDGVHFAGMRQPEELPQYYGHANCFVLPSISEPWGLVVNEAMASGLAVLVSDRCGCARELVKPGLNGFMFDPLDRDSLVEMMQRISSGDVSLDEMRRQSLSIIANYTPLTFAERTAVHFQILYQRNSRNASLTRRIRRLVAQQLYSVPGLLT
jgi:glycosyltransferase involved in cell wall biosynthesis